MHFADFVEASRSTAVTQLIARAELGQKLAMYSQKPSSCRLAESMTARAVSALIRLGAAHVSDVSLARKTALVSVAEACHFACQIRDLDDEAKTRVLEHVESVVRAA
jgi:hypothetical protein